jgi:hypothetical protein
MSSKWSLHFRISNQNFVCSSHFSTPENMNNDNRVLLPCVLHVPPCVPICLQNLILCLDTKLIFSVRKKPSPLPEVDEFSEFSWQATQLVTGQVKGT